MLDERQTPSVCPKTGKPIRISRPIGWKRWLFPIAGLGALIWFLVRVIPKPSRAAYPCQRIALPIASGFVVWLVGLFGSMAIFHMARRNWHQARFKVAAVCLVLGLIVTAASSVGPLSGQAAAASHTDPPNSPMGVAQGINPGRVSWVYDPTAAVWNGTTGNWWDEGSTNQASVDSMLSRSIQSLTSTTSDAAAWDALFRSFNQRHGKGNVGYAAGETIVIKLNNNEGRGSYAANNKINGSPQLVLALTRQLVNNAGVSQNAITFYDASRYMIDNIYNKLKPEFPNVQFMDCCGQNGRLPPNWVANAIPYSRSNTNGKGLPRLVVDASYMINMAIMKLHGGQGITLIGKNHVGSISSISHQDYGPTSGYETFVDFMAHKDLGQNTFLFMIDSLYGHNSPDGVPNHRWNIAPFNGRWPSSLFVSQDQVALDSVGYDFLSAEYPTYGDLNNGDHYLHEAALANNPPSGVLYAPNGDGIRAPSLGAHEHWNNNTDRKYTRNLGTGNGIELVYIGPTTPPPTTPPPTTPPPTTPPGTTPPPSGNLALNKPVTFSNQQAGNEAAKAVDGSTTTRWAGSPWPQWIQVDLGSTTSINLTELMPYANRAYQYRIEVSSNGTSYTTAVDRTANTTGGATLTDSFAAVSARYVRLTVTGCSGYTGGWASFYEFRIFGSGTPPPTTPPPTTPPPTTPPPTTPPPTTPPPTTPPPTTPPAGQAPYGGTAWAVPGTIQAENYDTGGEGVAYHDTETANQGGAYRSDGVDIQATTDTGGGYNAGWTAAGEWLEYTINVTAGGTYTLSARVAAPSAGGSIHAEIDGANVTGAMPIAATGGWQTWSTVVSGSFSLAAGQHILRIAIDAAGMNLNWVSLQSGATPPPTTPPPTTPPPSTNLARGMPVVCSSNETGYSCPSAVDGNMGTRWSSAFSDPQWIFVDLGATYSIGRVVLHWEAAYATAYRIDVSSDAATWTTIRSVTGNTTLTNDLSVSGSGRYIRMYGTARATGYGYSLWEYEVYGN